jgi:hypothetical protein
MPDFDVRLADGVAVIGPEASDSGSCRYSEVAGVLSVVNPQLPGVYERALRQEADHLFLDTVFDGLGAGNAGRADLRVPGWGYSPSPAKGSMSQLNSHGSLAGHM